jgi:hypothetical protein
LNEQQRRSKRSEKCNSSRTTKQITENRISSLSQQQRVDRR